MADKIKLTIDEVDRIYKADIKAEEAHNWKPVFDEIETIISEHLSEQLDEVCMCFMTLSSEDFKKWIGNKMGIK